MIHLLLQILVWCLYPVIHILNIKKNKNYLFELKDKRKFDYETLKLLNKADTQAHAHKLAENYWQNRSKQYYAIP